MKKVAVVLCNNMHMDIANANTILNLIIQNKAYEVVCDYTIADIVIVVTCAFGPNKMYSMRVIADVCANSKTNAKVIVTGCLLKLNREELESIPGICVIPFEKIGTFLNTSVVKMKQLLPQNKVIISEGCLHKCSYCVYPMLVQKYKSKPIEMIMDEVKELYETESTIYITGAQETADYGIDLYGERCFAKLLNKIVTEFPNSQYVIGWFHPAGLTDEVISVISNHHNVSEIMLHIQHVDEKILKQMNRPTFEDVNSKIAKLKSNRPDLIISTEVIVGFPGEGEDEFQELIQYLNKGYFSDIGVASYEPVLGTKAALLKNQVEPKVKKQRMRFIQESFSATCYPVDENSNESVIEEYLRATIRISNMPKNILKNRQMYHLIAGVDTRAKFEDFEKHIKDVYERVCDSRSEYDFNKNYKYFEETYTSEAKEMFFKIINNGSFKEAIKARAQKLLLGL